MKNRTRMRKLAAMALLATITGAAGAQETIDYDALTRIRKEARERSHVLKYLHQLTDVHGPRLTGSPQYKAAAEWTAKELTGLGLQNARLEPWDFGHPGWSNERFVAHLVAPVKDALVGEVVAWTPGTAGPVRARALRIEPPKCVPTPPAPGAPAPARGGGETCPTPAELEAYLATVKDQVKGALVLVGKPAKVDVAWTPTPLRRDEEQLRRTYDPENPAPSPFDRPEPKPDPTRLTARSLSAAVDAFLVANGAAARIEDAGRDHGQVRAFQNRTYDVAKAVPTVVLRNEDYGRISRLLDGGAAVELELDVVNRTWPEGTTQYNVVAEIPGADKADEVVMLGAHLDSWHAATGATDNAVNVAVMMEAVRILKALGLQPRRAVRIALWGGEEQGLLGSKAYVEQHFGTFEAPKPEYAKLAGYVNIDSGTGRVRGASAFGPKEAGVALRDLLAPFEDLGVVGAIANQRRRSGGTDTGPFAAAGLPAIGLGQDPVQYFTHTWHTNLDTYERVVEDEAIRSAIVVAGLVHHLANRDALLPRLPKDKMPAPPAPTPE